MVSLLYNYVIWMIGSIETRIFAIALAIGLIGGVVANIGLDMWRANDKASLISEFYAVENAVHVSPHSIRKMMDKGDTSYILIDLRSAEEYNKEHIIGAINIPAYNDKDHSDYGAIERIVEEFSKLPKDKDIIVYCYSTPCMTGRKVGQMLAQKGIYVRHLGIGWNDWRYDWTAWNHEHEWNLTNVSDYIGLGPEPGKPKVVGNSASCPIDNRFGC
jgi:rhodanese-related sulfurtransferase